MKQIHLFSSILILVFFTACSATKTISLQVARPARIDIPAHIKTLVIINRTNPGPANLKSTVEAILTGEVLSSDKGNVEECLNGLQQFLTGSKRIAVVRGNEYLGNGNSIQNFGDPLPWSEVEALCQKYNTDALLTLEYFDTDFIVTHEESKTQVATSTQPGIVYKVQSVTNVKAGFRIYDPKMQNILYQDQYNKSYTENTQAGTVAQALTQIASKEQAMKNLSYNAGQGFAKWIIPAYVWEDRWIYKGKSDGMGIAMRAGLVNDWDTALETWRSIELNGPSKDKGSAAFNMALAYEVFGDFKAAKEWVQKAYIQYAVKKAENYSYIIDTHIRNQERVNKQLSDE